LNDGNLQGGKHVVNVKWLSHYLSAEADKRQKVHVIGMVHNNQINCLVKDVIDILFHPLSKIFEKAPLAELVQDTKGLMRDIILIHHKYSDVSGHRYRKAMEEYVQLAALHQQALYRFVQKVLSTEGEFFENVICWTERLFNFIRKGISTHPINMESLVLSLDNENKQQLIQELQKLEHYRKYKKKVREMDWKHRIELTPLSSEEQLGSVLLSYEDIMDINETDDESKLRKNPPELRVIPTLVSQFVEMTIPILVKHYPPQINSCLDCMGDNID